MEQRAINSRIEALESRKLLTGGLFGQYYDGTSLHQLRMTRNDIGVAFDFGAQSPFPTAIQPDDFSARWTGQVLPEFSESYTFHLTADDGVRLWVDNQLLIDRWSAANQIAGDANHDDTVNLAGR